MKRIVFIGGCDRSGTTMIADHIGSPPDVVVTPESQFKVPLLRMLHCGDTAGALGLLREDFRFGLWRLSPDERRLKRTASPGEFLFELVDQYARANGKPDWRVWVDHTPDNIRHWDVLSAFVTEVKFVFAVRDGRAVAASVIPLDWGPGNAYHAGFWWSEKNAAGLALLNRSDSSVMQVRFEDLLSGEKDSWYRLLEHCGMPRSEAVFRGGGFRVPEYTLRQHRLVGGGLDSSKVDAWRSVLGKREVELFEYVAGGLLSAFDYERQYELPRPPDRRELAVFGGWMGKGPALSKRIRNYMRRRRGAPSGKRWKTRDRGA